MMLAAKDLSLAGRVDTVSAILKPGEVTAICGPNGAGKSSLLALLAGLLAPDDGTVSLAGRQLHTVHPRDRAKLVGYLPQDPVVAWDIAVHNLVALGRLPHGDRGETQVAAAMEALDLGAFADRPISKLSGGERARALLARVIAGEPHWILADEPFAALDLGHQLELMTLLRREADRGRGVALVLHDLQLAMNHADRVLVLDEGRLASDGPPETALQPNVISAIWGVHTEWVGSEKRRALVTGQVTTPATK